ncbi:MAG TPA: V-type ATPase 116kDa subunit family protein, partial [Thermoanaerobaculia bacterium]
MMLRSVEMVHFRAQVPNRDAALATRAIASEGLLHLVDIAHGRAPYDASPPGVRELYAAFRDLSRRIRTTADRLGVPLAETAGAIDGEDLVDFAAELERIVVALEPLEKRVQELVRALGEAQERCSTIRHRCADAGRLRLAALDLERLAALRFASVRIAIAPAESLDAMATILAPASHAIVPLDEQEDSVLFAAVVPLDSQARLEEATRLTSARVIALPKSAAELEACHLETEIADAERAVADAQRGIEEERAKSLEGLQRIARRAEAATLLLQAQTFFAAAGRFVVISGWVPREGSERLKARVAEVTKSRAVIDLESAESLPGMTEGTLRVPILHRNPLLLRPFQKLIDIYGTPSYAELEPTGFFAV